MARVPARWLDLGQLSPTHLHAAYQGLAEAAAPDAEPMLVWAQCTGPHLALGASQTAGAELDLDACRRRGVDLVQRPLGGGTVLVDPNQYCFFLLFPDRHRPSRHQGLFDQGLATATAVYHAFDLPVQRIGANDLWLDGRRILGSGAATLGSTMVFGASFLLAFDHALFAALVQAPSAGFRRWLAEEVRAGMTGWREHSESPAAERVQARLREAVHEQLGWDTREAELGDAEHAAIEEALEEVTVPPDATAPRRLVANGIKINHSRYLVETADPIGRLRLAIADREIRRLAVNEEQVPVLEPVIGCEPEASRVAARLRGRMPAADIEYWARRIDAAAAGVRRVWDG